MHEADGGNAMTEVALALAMAFFSISILALVSMGAGGATPRELLETALAADQAEKPDPKPDTASDAAAPPQYLFYWQDQFYDQDLTPTRPNNIAPDTQLVLVFPPDLPFEDVMRLRQQTGINGKEPVIAQMSPDWVATFRNREN